MKKALFLFILIAAASQLKAQSLQLQPVDTLKTQLFKKQPQEFYKKYFFKGIPDSSKFLDKNGFLFKDKKPVENQYAYNNKSVYTVPGYSMPIKRLENNSKMPVIKPNNNPVAK